MADTGEAAGQDVADETSEEFLRGQAQGSPLVALRLVASGKPDLFVVGPEGALVRQRGLVGIAGQVVEHQQRFASVGLGLHNSVSIVQSGDE